MHAKVTIELSNGTILTGNLSTSGLPDAPPALMEPKADKPGSSSGALDFSLPIRPFMNEHADGLSGSKKFALLVAYLAKGEIDAPVDRAEAVESWNKMTGLMGGKFNGAHESRAKDSGWIYVPKAGTLALLKKWEQALS